MVLIVTAKNQLKDLNSGLVSDQQTQTAFRQVENWANNIQWRPIVLAAGWSNIGSGFQIAQYCIDGFGFIHLRGMIQYAGTPASGQSITVLPPSYSPILAEEFNPYSSNITLGNGVRVESNGNVIIVLGVASVTNPMYSLSGINYTTF